MDDTALKRVGLALLLVGIGAILVNGLDTTWRWPDLISESRTEQPPRQRPRPQPEPPPPLGENEVLELPSVTVSYTAIEITSPVYQPARRAEIVEAGAWRLERSTTREGESNLWYKHKPSGASIVWTRGPDSAQERFGASRRDESRSGWRAAYTNTGQTIREGGETCTIWNGRWINAGHYGHNRTWRMCITDDGLHLWARHQEDDLPERETVRLTSIERRSIVDAEVRPPAYLFEWSYWLGAEDAAAGDDLAIDMASPRGSREQDQRRVRVRSGWTSTFNDDAPNAQIWETSSASLYLRYQLYGESYRQLSISRAPQPRPPAAGELLEPRRAEVILGRRCTWFDFPAASHSFSTACRTVDGLALAIRSGGDGVQGGDGLFEVRATRISRAALPASAISPPSEAFDWPR